MPASQSAISGGTGLPLHQADSTQIGRSLCRFRPSGFMAVETSSMIFSAQTADPERADRETRARRTRSTDESLTGPPSFGIMRRRALDFSMCGCRSAVPL